MTYETISFFSDLGHGDENVGLAHSIIREVAPLTSVVDICHSIGLGDTRSAALMIARSVPYLAPGIVLAVVDHAMDRPPIAVEVGDGQAVLVGPDSGVLGAAVAVVGGAQRAIRLTSDQYRIPSPGALHEGRDVLAPAAAHLAAGVRLEDLGDLIDPAALVPSLVPVPRVDDSGAVASEVLGVDRRGAVQLNVDRETITMLGPVIVAAWHEEKRVMRVVDTGEEVASGQFVLAEDPHGLMSIVAGNGSASSELKMGIGTEVTLSEAK
jgi:S-adenosylmethionine hydrolase